MKGRAALALVGASLVSGADAASHSLLDAIRAGRSSDEWALEVARVLPFPKALETWKRRAIVPSDVFDELQDELKGQAGRLVGIWHTSFTDSVYRTMYEAIESGATLYDVAPKLQQLLDGFGAAGGERIYSGETWSPWYADLVFRNATQASYAAGRYSEMFSQEWIEAAPYWLYDAVNDSRTRPAHKALDGLVFRKTDPGARVLLVPSDHGCRCSNLELTEADLKAGRYKVTSSASVDRSLYPPPGWDADRVLSLVPEALRRQM